jgi:CRP/FNR family transcriptional regulator
VGTDPARAGRLAAASRAVALAPGEVLFSEGGLADEFAIVDAGEIRGYHLTAGGRSVTLERIGPGDAVGLGPALTGGRHDTMSEAATDGAVVLVRGDALQALAAEDPMVARAALTEVTRRSERLMDAVRALAADVPSRLASYLFGRALAVGRPSEEGLVVDLGMTKTELASTLATVPETLSRAFARLRSEGLIELDGSRVTVLDVGGLVRRSAGYEEG